MKNIMATKADAAQTLLRVILGMVFFAHGAQKALGWFGGYGYAGTMGYFASLGIPSIFGMLAICAEFLGGIALILGLLTRVAAAGIIVDMITAIVLVHKDNGLFINWNLAVNGNKAVGEGIEFHLLAIAMALALLARGGGALSADHAIAGSK
jgi:putative oxidoreductase